MDKFIDDKEFEQTMAEAKKKTGKSLNVLTLDFDQPQEWEGQTFDKLTFNWNKLAGEDFLAIEQAMNLRKKVLVSAEFSTDFILEMAVRCCEERVDAKFLCKLPIGAFTKIRNGARDFLIVSQA